ncbi:MAG: 2,3-diphosphoglycerate synthetase [Candidatus Geothermincolia bacterium]
MPRALFLIDGEHYPPVTASAIRELAAERSWEPAGLFFLGGTEKVEDVGELRMSGVPLIRACELPSDLMAAIDAHRPEIVVDLSDEPVISSRERFRLASAALARGVAYVGADFRFQPPGRERKLTKPSCSIIGSGKRSGKTAISAHLARSLRDRGHSPVIVVMGRGGPERPQLLLRDEVSLTPEFLLSESASGRHAASDHYEDALMARVTTIGCRRCGGGMAGQPFTSNIEEGLRMAAGLPEDVVLLEGSGTAIPPCAADLTVLVASAAQPIEYLACYFGTYRLLISDFCVITMAENPFADSSHIIRMEEEIRRVREDTRILRTVFRPFPLQPIRGRSIFLATTAPRATGPLLADHLESEFGCEVAGTSHALADRSRLREELAAAPPFEVLLTELKAAAIDVATRFALEHGREVVYADNLPVSRGEQPADEFFQEVTDRILR